MTKNTEKYIVSVERSAVQVIDFCVTGVSNCEEAELLIVEWLETTDNPLNDTVPMPKGVSTWGLPAYSTSDEDWWEVTDCKDMME